MQTYKKWTACIIFSTILTIKVCNSVHYCWKTYTAITIKLLWFPVVQLYLMLYLTNPFSYTMHSLVPPSAITSVWRGIQPFSASHNSFFLGWDNCTVWACVLKFNNLYNPLFECNNFIVHTWMTCNNFGWNVVVTCVLLSNLGSVGFGLEHNYISK